MAEFEVYPSKLVMYAENQRKTEETLSNLQARLNICILELEQQLHSELYPEIKGRLQALSERLGRDAVFAENMADVLEEICALYQRTEREITGYNVIPGKINLENSSAPQQTTDNGSVLDEILRMLGVEEDAKGMVKLINMLSKLIKEHDGESIGAVFGPYISYLESLFNFYNGTGETGDFLKLGEKSTKLWNALYSILDKKYEFAKCMPYGGHMANLSTEVSIFGSIFGLYAGFAEAMDMEGKNWGEVGSDYMKAFGKFGDVLKEFYKAGGGEVAKNGGWFTLADMGIGTVSQIIESTAKYSEDGTFDFWDFNETAADASVAGLTKLVKGLTLGIVDLDEDYVADVLKSGATDKGTEVGNYINSHPELREKAVNGNVFDKIYAYSYAFWCS